MKRTDSKLFKAIASEDADEIRRQLKAGANPNAKGDDGLTPLDMAAKASSAALAEALISGGADVIQAGLPGRAFAWLAGLAGEHASAIEEEMREAYRPLLEDPKRKRWVQAIRAGDVQGALKAGKPPKEWRDYAQSPELLPFPADMGAHRHWKSVLSGNFGGLRALRHFAPDAIPYFQMSLAEAFLVDGNHEALEAALSQWASPERRCLRGVAALPDQCPGAEIRGLHYGSFRARLPLVGLAALRKDERAMRALIRAGLGPRLGAWGEVAEMVRGIADASAHESDFDLFETRPWAKARKESSLASMGVAKEDSEAIENWVLHLSGQAYDIYGGVERGGKRREEALRLIAEGAPPSREALAIATHVGDAELVRALLEAGAEPNFSNDFGVPMLARQSSAPLDVLAIWMEHGACPALRLDSREPDFGDDTLPSAIYQAVWSGNQDLVGMLLEKSAVPVKMVFSRFGKTVAPMEALALSRGDDSMAIFLRSLHESKLFGGFGASGAETTETTEAAKPTRGL